MTAAGRGARVFGLRAVLVLAFAALTCARMPEVVMHGRLWAEEGTKFYRNAATLPWRQALLFPWGGYLNLVANAAPMIARRLVRLEAVPWVTEAIGLAFQCVPAIILVCSRDAWLRRPLVLPAALLLIATAPGVEEVYLETLHSQFHLALACALILALDIPGRALGLFGGAVLFLAPLCGPAAWVLIPLFGLRTLIDRSVPRALQTAALAAGTAIQLAFFFTHEGPRSHGLGPILLLCIVAIKQLALPLLGRDIAGQASGFLQQQITGRLFPWQAVAASLIAIAALTAATLRRGHAAAAWLLCSASLITWIAYYGSIGGPRRLLIIGDGARYAFIPEVLAALTVLAIAAGTERAERWAARSLAVWLLLVGAADLPAPSPVMKQGPRWLAEVAAWRADHAHAIALWPTPWVVRLPSE